MADQTLAFRAEKLELIANKTARAFTSIAFAAFMGPPPDMGFAAATGFFSGMVTTGNVKGAMQGAFSAGMFFGVGNVLYGGNFFDGGKGAPWSTSEGVALHGVVGCVTTVAGGGKCGPGAFSAAFFKAVSSSEFMNGVTKSGDVVTETVVSAVAGGTSSVLGGGKFANGAVTGSFGYLYNEWAHSCRYNFERVPLSPELIFAGEVLHEIATIARDTIDANCNGSVCFHGSAVPLSTRNLRDSSSCFRPETDSTQK